MRIQKVFTQIKTTVGALCYAGAVASPTVITPLVPPQYAWAIPAGQIVLGLVGSGCVGKAVWNAWKEESHE